MKTVSTLAVFCGLALCFFCFTGAILMAEPTAPLADDDGKETFIQNCAECHGVKVAEIEAKTKDSKLKGPDLTNIGEKYQTQWIKRYVKEEVDKDGQAHLKKFKGSDEELQAIVDWLGSLEAQE